MEISLNGMVELIGHEGICLSPYYDSVGVVTIGIGATRSEISSLSLSHPSITMKEAIDLLKKSIVKYTDPLNRALKVPVHQEQFDALASITYNIGVGGMQKSTFIKRINNKQDVGCMKFLWYGDDPVSANTRTMSSINYEESVVNSFLSNSTIVDAILLWDKPKEIIGRRTKEARLFQDGVYSNNGKALLFPVNSKTHHPMYNKGQEVNVYNLLDL